MGGQRVVAVGGVELCVQARGDAGAPAVLLIAGATNSMDWWDEEFCDLLAAGPRYVIRYDQRDTGRSVTYPAGAPGYGEADLAADAVGVLDVFGVGRAHLVGISMGGFVAQRLAVEHPDRVASLTLVSTSPGGLAGGADLPPMSAELAAAMSAAGAPDWSDRASAVEHTVAGMRLLSAPAHFDPERARAVAGQVFDRSTDMAASMANHLLAAAAEPTRPRLGGIAAPTLVVHGTADPLFPYGHAEALAREIPGAELLPLPGVGHQLPPPATWPTLVPALLRHTAG
jgi:pimeloyl-ACP methyl ester carboxylesterase